MKNIIIILLYITVHTSFSQPMNNLKLGKIINEVSDTVKGASGRWQFAIKGTPFICITDENNNRMRIISPITESKNLDDNMKTNALVANFHSALDVKYAISDGVLWSVFVHPLKELSRLQIKDAISQVFYANKTFGTTYSSTGLIFGGDKNNQPKPQEEELIKQRF